MRCIVVPFSDLGASWSANYHLQRGHARAFLEKNPFEERHGPKWDGFLVRLYRRWLKDAKMEFSDSKRRYIVAALSGRSSAKPQAVPLSHEMFYLMRKAWLVHEISRLKVQKILINQRLQCLRNRRA